MASILTFLSIVLCVVLPFRIPLHRKLTLIFASHAIAFAKTALLFNSDQNDSWQYFDNTRGLSFEVGTGSIVALTQVLRGIVDNYFAVSAIFSFTTILAVLMLSERFHAVTVPRRIWEVALFYAVIVSGVVFWGAGIGKDGIVLLGVTVFVCAILKLPRIKILPIFIAILLITPIRPHVSLLLLSGLGMGIAISHDVSLVKRFTLTIAGALAFIGGAPLVMSYLGIEGSIGSTSDYLEEFSTRFEGTRSYVDISSLPAPLRILSFFLRPLPIEARGLMQVIASLQNVGIAIYIWVLLRDLTRYRLARRGIYPVLLATGLAVGFVLSFTASNLGLATRQKWMALIPLLVASFILQAQVRSAPPTQRVRRNKVRE